MNEYQIAVIICVCILGLWAAAYLLCWAWQFIWGWIDDSKVGKKNLLIKSFKDKYSIWKYPVYNGKSARDKKNIFGHAKDKKFDGALINDYDNKIYLKHNIDYIYGFDDKVYGFLTIIVLVTSIVPLFLLLCFNFYPIAISIGILFAVAQTARFSRRLSKKYKLHVSDKKVHIPAEKQEKDGE